MVGSGVAWWVVADLFAGSGLPGVVWGPLVLGSGLLWFWCSFWRWPRAHAERKLAELACGYTTLTWVFGGVTPTVDRRFRGTDSRVPWDYRGVWVLSGDGRVLSVPDPSVEPPGFFPSPNRPRSYELWTGSAWYGLYREPA